MCVAAIGAVWSKPGIAEPKAAEPKVLFTADVGAFPSQGILVDRDEQLPVLGGDGVWRLGSKPMDIAKYVRTANVRIGRDQDLVALVSLGAQPTYGQFLRTALSLRDRELCGVALLEDGEQLGRQIGVPGFTIC